MLDAASMRLTQRSPPISVKSARGMGSKLTLLRVKSPPESSAAGDCISSRHETWPAASAKIGVPWRFSRTPGALETWTPKLGQHNEYVLGELLGLDRTEIDALVEQEVIY